MIVHMTKQRQTSPSQRFIGFKLKYIVLHVYCELKPQVAWHERSQAKNLGGQKRAGGKNV